MPIHDWTRVDAGIWHSFHTTWIGELTKSLNGGLLPTDYYALGEQLARGIGPDVLTLQTGTGPSNGPGPAPDIQGALAVATAPPRVRFTVRAEREAYTRKRRTIVIRHRSGHRMVALLEILSPGNKASRQPFRAFLDKAGSALARGIHLLLIDLFPPGPRDPRGLHATLWHDLTGELWRPPSDKPLTLAAYPAGTATSYVEPAAVGDSLPDMPLFLDPDQYVYVPLESTYQAAYAGVPRFYRSILEAEPGAAVNQS